MQQIIHLTLSWIASTITTGKNPSSSVLVNDLNRLALYASSISSSNTYSVTYRGNKIKRSSCRFLVNCCCLSRQWAHVRKVWTEARKTGSSMSNQGWVHQIEAMWLTSLVKKMRQDKSRPLQTHLKSPKDQLTKHFWLIAKKTNRKDQTET